MHPARPAATVADRRVRRPTRSPRSRVRPTTRAPCGKIVPQVRIALLAIVLSAGVASADSAKDRSARAAKLFEEGRDLARVANYQDACDHFAQSYELDPAAGTAVNFADCQEHLGHLAR